MKKLAVLAAAILAASAWSQVYVAPHVRSDGTFVQGHWRSAPDHTTRNNYGTQGNVNPYTGQQGTVNPYQQPQQPHYPQGSMYQQPNQFGSGVVRPGGRAF
jgi:hypothetical protein